MNSQFSLKFSDPSGEYHLKLKEVDHPATNSVVIAGRSYKIKGSEAAITQLKSHLKVNEFESFHQFKASLQEDLGIAEKASVVFQRIIKNSDQPEVSLHSMPSSSNSFKPGEAEAISAIQSKVIALDEANKFSGTILITRLGSGEPLVAKSVGYANIELQQKNNLETQYNIASIGKIFTAVAVLQLVEEGKLSLEDPIGKFLPEISDEKMKSITVRQLLTHTGGTGSIAGDFRTISHFRDYVEVGKDRQPLFEPGTQCKYSNFGFVLLGAIIENISQKDYYQYIQERVFDAAGMQHSSFPLKTDLPPNAAAGYVVTQDDFVDNQDVLPLRATPAGCGYSTGPDLIHFSNALLEGRLLHDPNSLDLIQKTQTVTSDEHPTQHSMGFMTGEHWFGHAGHYDGANGELRIYPQAGYVVAVLANRDQEAASDLTKFIEETLLGQGQK